MSNTEKEDKTVAEVVGRTALEEVEKRILARNAEEAGAEDSDNQPDEFAFWKRESTLETLHQGLIEVSRIAEAAVETSLLFRSDLRRALPILDRTSALVEAMGPRVESTGWLAHKIDDELARANKSIHDLRIAVQGVQTDLTAIKDHISQIPAIKGLLVEILSRLPEQSTKPQQA